MGQTTGDLLPWPELPEPGNIPQDMQELAAAVQTGLNKRGPADYAQANISRRGGWQGNQPLVQRIGKLVLFSSIFERNAALTVTANEGVELGNVSAPNYPKSVERFECAWSDGGVRRAGHVYVGSDGVITWYPTVNATLAAGDWVSVSGVVYVTS